MNIDVRVLDLLSEWQAAEERGELIEVEVLCAAHPELNVEVRRRIEMLAQMRWLAAGPDQASLSGNADTVSLDPETGLRALDFLDAAQAKDEIGRLGQFRILKELGRGGMGCVLLAEDTKLDRLVALKVMLPKYATNPTATARFLREAKAAASLHHNHVVTIFAVGAAKRIPFIAMEYLKGMALDRYLQERGELPLPTALRIGREIGLGLQAAHEMGLVHRDIKPPNIWLEAPKGRVKILDFGLARHEDEAQLTQSGAIIGTPAYMAPEQVDGAKLDGRADLFSLGVLLYRLVAGTPAFSAPTTAAMLVQVTTHEPPSASEIKSEVPAEASRIIAKLMAKNKEDRYASATDFLADWEALIKETQKSPATASPADAFSEVFAQLSSLQLSKNERLPLPTSGRAVGFRLFMWLGLVALGVLAIGIITWQVVIRPADDQPNLASNGQKKLTRSAAKAPQKKPPVTAARSPQDRQREWAIRLKCEVESKSPTDIVMVVIPPEGSRFVKPYLLGKYEVTQGEWDIVMVYNPSSFHKGNKSEPGLQDLDTRRLPVETVSWFDCVEFCNKLSDREGLNPYYEINVLKRKAVTKLIEEAEVTIVGGSGYHLPTDLEWEHACRAGARTEYYFGDKAADLPQYAWFDLNSNKRPHTVGELKPNAFGLHDMLGNVREWIEDQVNKASSQRAARGGAWPNDASSCTISLRASPSAPGSRSNNCGFRLARRPILLDE